jgi:hypothetical protein
MQKARLPVPSGRADMEYEHGPADWLVAVTIGRLKRPET